MITYLRKIAVTFSNIALSILGMSRIAHGFLRFRHSYVIERWEGDRSLSGARRIAVFVHYDRRGRVHDYVTHYLTTLVKAGFEIVFVSNSPRNFRRDLPTIRPFCGLVLRRKNIGYDFGGYKDGLFAIPNLAELDELIFANDSAYGPFCDLAPMLSRCDDSAAIWGITDSWDTRFHLQSYFLLFKKTALTHPRMLAFWRRMRYFQSKRWIVSKYEVGLTQEAIRFGLRCAALFPQRRVVEALTSAVLNQKVLQREDISDQHRAYLQRVYDAVDHGSPLNTTHFFWDYLITDLGCPFLKRELLAVNPMGVPFLSQWQTIIERTTGYNADLILRHLEATMRDRVV
jgi:lipopolysaccharide biosynthesis protein